MTWDSVYSSMALELLLVVVLAWVGVVVVVVVGVDQTCEKSIFTTRICSSRRDKRLFPRVGLSLSSGDPTEHEPESPPTCNPIGVWWYPRRWYWYSRL